MPSSTRGFFLMYGEAIKTLQDELVALVGVELARSVLFRFGWKNGQGCAREMGLTGQGDAAMANLHEIWTEMGLARLVSIKSEGSAHTIRLEETLESSFEGRGCDFTRGFLAGLLSGITNRPHYCEEEKCTSRGDKMCVFVVERKV